MMNPSGATKMQGKIATAPPPRGDPYSKHNWNTNVDDDVADEAEEDDVGEDLAVGHMGSGQNLQNFDVAYKNLVTQMLTHG